jgi:hypothetical protein
MTTHWHVFPWTDKWWLLEVYPHDWPARAARHRTVRRDCSSIELMMALKHMEKECR